MENRWSNLTEKQKEIYDLYINNGMTLQGIGSRLGISHQAVWKILQKLKKKGLGEGGVEKRHMPIIKGGLKNHPKYYRLHNLHLVITPYYFYPRFSKNIGKIFFIGKYTVTCNARNIEVQTRRQESFDSEDLDKCYFDFREDLEERLGDICDRLGCEIVKEGKMNIRLANSHIAEVNNGVARRIEGQKLSLQGEDGKVRLLIDVSTGLPELEGVHATLSHHDMELVKKHMTSWVNPECMTLWQIDQHIRQHILLLYRIGKQLGFDDQK